MHCFFSPLLESGCNTICRALVVGQCIVQEDDDSKATSQTFTYLLFDLYGCVPADVLPPSPSGCPLCASSSLE